MDLKIISLHVRVEVTGVGEVIQRENIENEEKKAEHGNLGNITKLGEYHQRMGGRDRKSVV